MRHIVYTLDSKYDVFDFIPFDNGYTNIYLTDKGNIQIYLPKSKHTIAIPLNHVLVELDAKNELYKVFSPEEFSIIKELWKSKPTDGDGTSLEN